MKKFFVNIIIFLVLILSIDLVFGKIMFYAESKSGSKNYHCMFEADEDILVLGSSYAVRNIVPSIIEENLGLSCYNAGEAGNGVLVAWARYNMFIKNHTPKMIIYTLTPGYDYIKSDEYSKYLNTLKPYVGIADSVTNMYENLMGWSESVSLESNLIKYNSYCIQLIYRSLCKNQNLQGYEPLYEVLTPYERDVVQYNEEYEIDTSKIKYLDMLFNDIKNRGIKIICVLPPVYPRDIDHAKYKEGFEICKKYDVPIINHKYCEGISLDNIFFYDISHLNDQGARLYTNILSNELKRHL